MLPDKPRHASHQKVTLKVRLEPLDPSTFCLWSPFPDNTHIRNMLATLSNLYLASGQLGHDAVALTHTDSRALLGSIVLDLE